MYSRNYLGSNNKSILGIVPTEKEKVLYTACVSVLEQVERKVKPYYVMRNHGNDAVVPDQQDFDQYRSGAATWKGFRVSYLAKLTRPEADEWMRRVSVEAASEDVVLVSDEEDVERCYRVLLAQMMANMFSGTKNLRYVGELK